MFKGRWDEVPRASLTLLLSPEPYLALVWRGSEPHSSQVPASVCQVCVVVPGSSSRLKHKIYTLLSPSSPSELGLPGLTRAFHTIYHMTMYLPSHKRTENTNTKIDTKKLELDSISPLNRMAGNWRCWAPNTQSQLCLYCDHPALYCTSAMAWRLCQTWSSYSISHGPFLVCKLGCEQCLPCLTTWGLHRGLL